MFLTFVDCVRNDAPGCLAQDVFLCHAPDFHGHRQRTNDFYEVMVEEGNATLDGVCHLHAVAKDRQNVAGSSVFDQR